MCVGYQYEPVRQYAVQTFLVKRLRLGDKVGNAARCAIRTEQAHNGSHARVHKLGQFQRRHLVGKAAFTAAARYMHMLVNIARRGNKAPAVYRLLYQPFRHVYIRGDLYYVPAAYQYVLHVRRLVIRPNVFQ